MNEAIQLFDSRTTYLMSKARIFLLIALQSFFSDLGSRGDEKKKL